jgi:hypothetical protein
MFAVRPMDQSSAWTFGRSGTRSGKPMFRGFMGQAVGAVCIPVWIALTVYFMSRVATPNAADAGNYFLAFAITTVIFIVIMTYWRRLFAE